MPLNRLLQYRTQFNPLYIGSLSRPFEREVSDVMTAAVKFADESPFPAPSELYNDVLAM